MSIYKSIFVTKEGCMFMYRYLLLSFLFCLFCASPSFSIDSENERVLMRGQSQHERQLFKIGSSLLVEGKKMLESGDRVEANSKLKMARKVLLEASEFKHVHASFLLASMFDRGFGGGKDDKKASRLYLFVADRELPKLNRYNSSLRTAIMHAQYNIGLFFEKGRGVKRNTTSAMSWFDKSMRNGCDMGCFRLGILNCRAGNFSLSIKLFASLVEHPTLSQEAKLFLAMSYLNYDKSAKGVVREKNIEIALNFLQQQDVQCLPHAKYLLAQMHLDGEGGMGYNEDEAVKLLTESAENGHRYALLVLNRLLESRSANNQVDILPNISKRCRLRDLFGSNHRRAGYQRLASSPYDFN